MNNKKYCLILFFIIITNIAYSLPYQIKPGFYYIIDPPVNIRSEGSLNGSIIGRLVLGNKIEIIECAFNEQTIDGLTAYWYKIKYNNIEGYVWGGLIAVETFIYDIDKNGVDDYFQYRYSKIENNEAFINLNNDIFIHINNRQIKTNFIDVGEPVMFRDDIRNPSTWTECYIYNAMDRGNKPAEGVMFFFGRYPGLINLSFLINHLGKIKFYEASY
jgi:hypothetical protein